MNKVVLSGMGALMAVGMIPCSLVAADAWSDCISRDLGLSRPSAQTMQEPVHYMGSFNFPEPSPGDSFSTYVYTYGDIVIFSYSDENVCKMSDGTGALVWSDTMKEDDYQLITGLEAGVYKVDIPRRAAVLSGDPFSAGLCCWFATGPDNRPLGTKLLTVGPKPDAASEGFLAVWAYENGTDVTVKNLSADSIEWQGTLDSAEYYLNDQGSDPPSVYSVTASKPVSVQEMNGVNGTYVPAFNGTFTGRDFMTYQHSYPGAPQDINIVPWEDNTKVSITFLDTGDTVWALTCEKRGEIKGQPMPTRRPLYIHADKDISVSQTEWASFGATNIAFYMARGIDRNGLGLGTDFYIPLETSLGGYFSKLHVIAFRDSTSVTVTRIPRDGGDESSIWSGTLNRGEYYRYTCPEGDATAHAIYHVVSSGPVTTIGSCYDRQGSDFYPVEQLYSSGSGEVPADLGSAFRVVSSIGREIAISYSSPSGTPMRFFVFDASGRMVDEIKTSVTPATPASSGTIRWGEGANPGIYFILSSADKLQVSKVTILK